MAPPRRSGRNPANAESQLFKALTRLFSGPIISYRSQSGRRIRRQHLDKYSSRFKSASGQQFKKSLYNPLDVVATDAIANQRRTERYVDFDQMEYTPEIASTLDIYADEMTTYTELRPMLNIKCSNEEIKAVLHILFDQVLNIQYNLFGWSRTMCKYGDFFLYLDLDDNYGVKSVIALPPQEIERLEGQDSTNPNYVQYQWNSAGMTFENWQICHFRILGNDKYIPYGSSILEPARRIWRQLTLMEDSMMAYRVVRSSERRVFKIDVGAIPPQDVEQYMEKIVTQLKRHSVVNPDTGRIDLRYNPMSIEEDYFIPVRAGSVTDIQSLAGAQNITAIDDVKYLRDKLFSALKIPQSYLTMGEGASEDQSTLAMKDIRFARTIQRLQRVIISELTKIGIIHLYTLGFRGDDLLGFELSLNNPSKIAELQELEHWKQKFDIAAGATEGYFSRRWVMENIFGMSNEEFIRNQREMFYDRKQDAALQAVAEEAAAGDLGGGGEDLGDLGDLGGGGEEPAAEPAGGGGDEETTLLAEPPAKRDDNARPNRRGPYKMQKKPRRSRRSQQLSNVATSGEIRGSTARTTFPGKTGFGGLDTLAKGMYQENQQNENLEEEKLFTLSNDIKMLLESLTKKDDKHEAQ